MYCPTVLCHKSSWYRRWNCRPLIWCRYSVTWDVKLWLVDLTGARCLTSRIIAMEQQVVSVPTEFMQHANNCLTWEPVQEKKGGKQPRMIAKQVIFRALWCSHVSQSFWYVLFEFVLRRSKSLFACRSSTWCHRYTMPIYSS